MNRKILLLNVALAALAAVLVWQIRVRWLDAKQHEREVLARAAKPQSTLAPPAAEAPKPAVPADYLNVAEKDLFARDRTPTVVIDPPPPPPAPPPPKPMPPLPFYHGQMAIGEPVVVLSLKGDDQKGYHVGDDVGPFKVMGFDRESITLEWEGQTVERKLAVLRMKELTAAAQQSQGGPPAPAAAAPSAPPAAATIKSLASPANASAATNANPEVQMGNDMGGGSKGCAAGDNSAAGTVKDGYRKVVKQGLMGNTCYWEQVK